MLLVGFHGIQKKRYANLVKKVRIKVRNFNDPKKEKYQIKNDIKKNNVDQLFGQYPFSIENMTIQSQLSYSPILFQENYRLTNSRDSDFEPVVSRIKRDIPLQSIYCHSSLKHRQLHLVVLVHDHNGSHNDMKLYKKVLSLILPHVITLNVKTMTNNKNKCLLEMAKDLANEITQNVKNVSSIKKISFISYGSGGVITRAALPYLQSFEKNMCTFISLDSPHLGSHFECGFFQSSNFIFWNTMKSNSVDNQLKMKDSKEKENSFLFKLANNDKMYWFKNIILFNCPQGVKSPCGSSLIQINDQMLNSTDQRYLSQMSHLIWKKIRNDVIVRVNVFLDEQQR
jgi:hypothetical protein